jgi:hypothetical protein
MHKGSIPLSIHQEPNKTRKKTELQGGLRTSKKILLK